jgi:hypothetical protein
MDSEKVTKIDAIQRQLKTAILLFLEDGDAVSIHTLTAAALQVAMDLGAKAGLAGFVKDLEFIKPEKHEFFRKVVNSAENFFKHADRDPEAVLEFYPAATPLYLADAAALYGKLGGPEFPALQVFHVWFMLNYPDVLQDGVIKEKALELVSSDPSLKDRRVALDLLRHLTDGK